ncbi:MAG: ATP-dependent DNA helicase RecG [Bacteroidia bacterium]|nr:MAG: ATP-dependent DNA helicase RecG [Bacteroidia bacterium]
MSALQKNIKYLKGVGEKKAKLLQSELNITRIEDLLYYFPFKYVDRSKIYTIREINAELSQIQIKGKITAFRTEGKSHKKRLIATFRDKTGFVELIWFQSIKWVEQNIKPNVEYIVFGKPNRYKGIVNFAHPEIEAVAEIDTSINTGLESAYNTTEKLKKNYITSKAIHKLQKNARNLLKTPLAETLPLYLTKKLNLMDADTAIRNIHFPENLKALEKAQFRFKFEELFYIQLKILKLKAGRQKKFIGFSFEKIGNYFNSFYYNNLPFELTNAQKRVLKEIRADLKSGKHMNRLLQGDVGSGKTLVALMSMLIALDNGFQACLMAPTEILASQHFDTIRHLLKGLHIEIALLTGSSKKKERTQIQEKLLDGRLQILVGTHALIEDAVRFNNLGIAVIDEQHRFGVAQRAKMWNKNTQPPHIIVMTATPIPRTLSMTVYGDLDISVIDELPPGRKPITTAHYYDSKRSALFGFLRKQIKEGRQIYIVYPLIKESEKMDYKDLEDGYQSIVRAFPAPQYSVAIVHGQMKPADKERSMQIFAGGQAQILVATTVIEVGVNVPNASVMVIESAERFGLSQLHQLRGRVGRGAEKSYCLLMTSYKLSKDAKKRIDTMVNTNDGFEIAEVDMKLRGPGDIEGTKQSGMPFELKIANIVKDGQILQYARDVAEKIIEQDPNFIKKENKILVDQLKKRQNTNKNWKDIS